MNDKQMKRVGFSLIEMSIIGILAAIVVPTFSNANETAKASALSAQLNTVKKSLVLYSSDHNGSYPTNGQMITSQWQALINSTDINGDTAGEDFGPYFIKPAFNAFRDSDVIAKDNRAAWKYASSTGTIQAVVPSSIYSRADALQLDEADLVVGP